MPSKRRQFCKAARSTQPTLPRLISATRRPPPPPPPLPPPRPRPAPPQTPPPLPQPRFRPSPRHPPHRSSRQGSPACSPSLGSRSSSKLTRMDTRNALFSHLSHLTDCLALFHDLLQILLAENPLNFSYSCCILRERERENTVAFKLTQAITFSVLHYARHLLRRVGEVHSTAELGPQFSSRRLLSFS